MAGWNAGGLVNPLHLHQLYSVTRVKSLSHFTLDKLERDSEAQTVGSQIIDPKVLNSLSVGGKVFAHNRSQSVGVLDFHIKVSLS